MSNEIIDIRSLKSLATKLPQGHPLRVVLALEDDWLWPGAFMAKVELWLRLLELEAASL